MDVEAMTRLFSFGCEMDGPIIFVYDFQNPIYARHGISFALLSHLDGLGLIRFDVLGGFKKFGLPRHIKIEYYEQLLELHYEQESYNELAFGCVLLHQPGHELAPLCRREGQFEIQQYLMEQWMQMGIAISSNINEKPKTNVA